MRRRPLPAESPSSAHAPRPVRVLQLVPYTQASYSPQHTAACARCHPGTTGWAVWELSLSGERFGQLLRNAVCVQNYVNYRKYVDVSVDVVPALIDLVSFLSIYRYRDLSILSILQKRLSFVCSGSIIIDNIDDYDRNLSRYFCEKDQVSTMESSQTSMINDKIEDYRFFRKR